METEGDATDEEGESEEEEEGPAGATTEISTDDAAGDALAVAATDASLMTGVIKSADQKRANGEAKSNIFCIKFDCKQVDLQYISKLYQQTAIE